MDGWQPRMAGLRGAESVKLAALARTAERKPEPPLSARVSITLLPGKRAGKADVLLVENDASVRRCVAELLGDAGLRVAEASSASEALALVHESGLPPMLVIDLYLGRGMDGAALIAALRARSPSLRAVLISGGEVPDGKLDGRDAFLRKPFHGDDLVRAVQGIRSEARRPC